MARDALLGKAVLNLVNRLRRDAGESEIDFLPQVVGDDATVLLLLREAITRVDLLIADERPEDADALRGIRAQLTVVETDFAKVLSRRSIQ